MPLNLGDKIPAFTLCDQNGDLFKSAWVVGKKTVVIYFYPKDFTPGCQKEACGFREEYSEFEKWKAEVIGISSDGIESHRKFSKSLNLPFRLLSDPGATIRKKFGIKKHLLGLVPGRETWVVDKKGVLQFKFHGLNASNHVEKALDTVKKLHDEN